MDAQDFRSLSEAYLKVYYDLDERYRPMTKKKINRIENRLERLHKDLTGIERTTNFGDPLPPKHAELSQQFATMRRVSDDFRGVNKPNMKHGRPPQYGPKISKEKEAKNREKGTQKEQVDLYDIILSHLLDEGYAETPEAAEKIMVNMSEEWRNEIVEARVDSGLSDDEKKR
jgi:hypothetical protein